MKKLLSLVLVVSLLTMIAIVSIPTVLAQHNAEVYWHPNWPKDISKGVLIDKSTKAFTGTLAGGFNATFYVKNLPSSSDNIVIVRVMIDRDDATNFVFFHFIKGYVFNNATGLSVPGWYADPTEFDPQGWAGTIIFNGIAGTPLIPGATFVFTLTFDQGPSSCNYDLEVFTVDQGQGTPGSGIPETEHHILHIRIDNELPIVQNVRTVPAAVGSIVTGIIEPCGHHYFNITAEAYDYPDHDTGLSRYEVLLNGVTIGSGTINSMPGVYTSSNPWKLPPIKVRDRPEGNYTVVVRVWDGVGNKGENSISFQYKWPPIPTIYVDPTEGHAALTTWIKDPVTGLIDSNQTTYKAKTLGTLVTVSGVHFDSTVDVTVRIRMPPECYGYYYGKYGKDVLVSKVRTKADGTFTATFIFPKAPAGIYNITVYSTPCNKSATFNVTPEIIYNPNEVIGPALINVEASGYIKPDIVPGTPSIYILSNNKDSLQGVNDQIDINWYFDGNGTLQNMITLQTGRFIENGIFWPALQPGTYNVTLFLYRSGKYWNLNHWDPPQKRL